MVKEEFERTEVQFDMDTRIVVEDPRKVSDSQIISLNGITARCFGKDVPLQETIDHIGEAEVLSLLMIKGDIRGYSLNSGLVLNETPVNYFGSGFIDPSLHDKGYYGLLNRHRASLIKYMDSVIPRDVIMTRTQNPKVYRAFNRLCLESGRIISPSFDCKVDEESLAIARAFFGGCTDGQICNDVYGRELMASTPKPDDATRKVMGQLDVFLGDAIILVGRRI